MTARSFHQTRESLRNIEKLARETADPVERLRFVRSQMDSLQPPESSSWPSAGKIAAIVAAAIGAALLVWRIS